MQYNETLKDQFAEEVKNKIKQALKDYKDNLEKDLNSTDNIESK